MKYTFPLTGKEEFLTRKQYLERLAKEIKAFNKKVESEIKRKKK